MRKHAAMRLIQRFDLDIDELRHVIKTGKMVKAPKKAGDIGVIERDLGGGHIRIKFRVQDDVLWTRKRSESALQKRLRSPSVG